MNALTIRRLLVILLVFMGMQGMAQTYFYVDNIAVSPPAPTTSDAISIDLIGMFSGGGVYVVNSSALVVGSSVQVTVNCADLGGITVLLPHTETIPIGQLPAGNYTIQLNGIGLGDFAPAPEHQFTVAGASTACDSLDILYFGWSPFDAGTIAIHVANTSSTLFDYPGFVILDDNGDTLALETVNFFGIGTDSWHTLSLHPSAIPPNGPFTGTLELWTGFFSDLGCTWPLALDLCPPAPCASTYPFLQNMGGAMVVASIPYDILDNDGLLAGTGNFELTNTEQFDLDTLCLEPGHYSLVLHLTSPVGGQLHLGMNSSGGFSPSVSTLIVQDAVPDTLAFTFFERCIDGTNSVTDHGPVGIDVRTGSDEWIITDHSGRLLGPIEIWDMGGHLVQIAQPHGSQIRIPTTGRRPGVYVLRCQVLDGVPVIRKALLIH